MRGRGLRGDGLEQVERPPVALTREASRPAAPSCAPTEADAGGVDDEVAAATASRQAATDAGVEQVARRRRRRAPCPGRGDRRRRAGAAAAAAAQMGAEEAAGADRAAGSAPQLIGGGLRRPVGAGARSGLVGGADEALDAGLLDRPAQAVDQLDRRFPAEQVAGAADVGAALLRIVGRQRLVDDLRARVGHLDHGLGQLQQGELVRVADVDRRVDVGLGEGDDAADQVVDVTEAAGLAAVAEDGQRPVLQRLAQEGRDRAAVVRRACAGRRC